MIGLVDCNNFFASCERVFNPSLEGKPIVVLSNNDGCVIARSEESKRLGIKMGVPFYQVKDFLREKKVEVFSSNYTLYGDLSRRVMTILSEQVPRIEVYSIDEAFLDLSGISSLEEFGKKIVRTTTRGSGIPVSLGVAPTRTLAKLANYFAKKYSGYQRVCIIDSEEKRKKALQMTPIGSVWGIGRCMANTLTYYGVETAYDFTKKPRSWVRNKLTVVGERTWLELQGVSCIVTGHPAEKQQIRTSRSFGEMVTDYESLRESVANFASTCAMKLRKQKSLAQQLTVVVHTNSHREDLRQYDSSKTISFSFATSDTTEIVRYASEALRAIYKEGYSYKKSGVILSGLIRDTDYMYDLFDPRDTKKNREIATVIDQINKKNGVGAIKLAAQGVGKAEWNLKRDYLSKCPSTNMKDIIEIKV